MPSLIAGRHADQDIDASTCHLLQLGEISWRHVIQHVFEITEAYHSEGLAERRLPSCPSLKMLSAALPLPAAEIVAAASPAVLALMKSRLCIGPPLRVCREATFVVPAH